MQYLPADDEQDRLMRELGALIRARGPELFIHGPIVEPTAQYFPDPVDSFEAGLDRVTRRLMQYAGLGSLDISIEPFEGEEFETTEGEGQRLHTAGCFLGIENGRCLFGINADLPRDIEHQAGVMAHEVAHAYRAYHRLCVDDRETEELLTDVTAVYLGFGILTVNNSHRFRKSGYTSGSYAITEYSSSETGYLSPQAHSFLLATQIVARRLDAGRRKAIYRHLETNQCAFVKAAVSHLEAKGGVARALGLSSLGVRMSPRQAEAALRPLKPYAPTRCERAEPRDADDWNAGHPVFRIHESRMIPICLFDTAVAGALGYWATHALFGSWLGLIPLSVAGLIVGVRRGRSTQRDVCSDGSCGAVLEPGVTRCPSCGGQIMGRIACAADRLEAEEQLCNRRMSP